MTPAVSPADAPRPSGTALRLDGATFAYGHTAALADITVSVEPGQAVALIGPNGAGKSTLLKGVLGLLPLVAGSMEILGEPRSRVDRSAVGYLPQSDDLDPEFPVSLRQVVMMGRYRSIGWFRAPGRADRAAVDAALDAVGLQDRARDRFGTLSGGQQQRGLLARALASEPRLLLLDEPFNGLDQVNRDALIETVMLLKARGVAVLVSTHDLELARQVCDRVLLLNGTQVAYGDRDEVLTLDNVQRTFREVQVELDEHTFVTPGHDGH
ncbi:metal ABC transporter ATP-binding protein [Planctomonas psychrotolerans]|uniref:metal ABC transporter ATP-binding protein n=1 Tax=Planctomonas psychrotolerans TaxID=2528712 RepID=UPI00123A00CC|nr:metal ABC transporter ATP-binding protein [Planctomonas psychrotolerans]